MNERGFDLATHVGHVRAQDDGERFQGCRPVQEQVVHVLVLARPQAVPVDP